MNPSSNSKSVMVLGDGLVAKNYLSSLVSRHGNTVNVVAGVSDPTSFEPMQGVRAVKADLWDKTALTNTLRLGNFCRIFLVLPGHADRLQMGRNGLEAVRDAGILQVVLVSVLTADTPSADSRSSSSESLQKLGLSFPSSPSPIASAKPQDPSKCVRIQRRNVLTGWWPMKVKIVQISLPDPTARCGKNKPAQQDSGIGDLQHAFRGHYCEPPKQKQPPKNAVAAAPAARSSPASSFLNGFHRDLAFRQELLNTASIVSQAPAPTAAFPPPPRAAFPLPLPPTTTRNHPHQQPNNNILFADILLALKEQQKALQRQPRWL